MKLKSPVSLMLNKYKSLSPSYERLPGEARKKKRPKYRSFRLYKHIKPNKFVKLPSAWNVLIESLVKLLENKKTVLVYVAIYSFFYSLLVKGLNSNLSLPEVKQILLDSGLSAGDLFTSFALFITLISSSSASVDELSIVYQTVLFIVGSLAIIWLIRKFSSRDSVKIRVKDSFYKGMEQLIPFLIVLIFITLQSIPALAGVAILSFISGETVSFGLGESMALIVLSFSLLLLSLYFISGSIAAIFIVTLPGAEPLKSLHASNRLLLIHRWTVLRKLLMFFIYIFVLNSFILIPLIMLLPVSFSFLVEYTFMVFNILNIIIFYNFIYTMYKKLL